MRLAGLPPYFLEYNVEQVGLNKTLSLLTLSSIDVNILSLKTIY